MPKRLSADLPPTAFSIARQFTGPPFSVMLESAELRRQLMEEIAHPSTEKLAKVAPGKKGPKGRAKSIARSTKVRRSKTGK